ncbi:MAG TPA: response regulator [Chitinophagaceae bacterium]|jgi:CheY-like chemotaxis protein|nr:response regulator [Chitinophagaceae bacterium]
MQRNPILIVDDDHDDLEMIQEVVKKLKIERPIHYFKSGLELRNFLETSLSPFLIICDVNLPGETGFEVRKSIVDNPEFKYKSVPFIFWSTDASEKQIQYAYDLPAQGFFLKPVNFNNLCATFQTILAYWTASQHPKKVS